MRILFLNQFFWPDSAPTGRLLEAVAVELVARGHQVTVICANGGYSGSISRPSPQVAIRHVPSLPFQRSKLMRLLSWGSFLLGSVGVALSLPRQDLVVAMTTPPALSLAAALLKLVRRTRFWIWEMDLYPDVVAGVGMFSSQSLLYRILDAVLDWPRHRAHGIIALGSCMRTRLLGHGLEDRKVRICENWAIEYAPEALPFSPAAPLRILYSGNLGMAHEIETLCGAMEHLRDCPGIEFVFCGGGVNRAPVEAFCRKHSIRNVRFLGYLESTAFQELLASSHLGLITLRNECLGSVVPNKAYSLLSAGRPLLFIGPSEATIARHIEEADCGWRFGCGDTKGLSAFLRGLVDTPELVVTAGEKSRAYYQSSLSAAIRVPALVGFLTE